MMLHGIGLGLLAFYPGGRPVPEQEFLDHLSLTDKDLVRPPVTGDGIRNWVLLPIALLKRRDFAQAEDPAEAFDIEVTCAFFRFAEFLDRQSPAAFRRFMEAALLVSASVEAFKAPGSLDLSFPARIHRALGRLDLPLRLSIKEPPSPDRPA